MALQRRQDQQDQFDIGDQVLVERRRYGAHPGGLLPGKIVNMAKGRVIVKFDKTGMCQPVDFKFLRLSPDAAKKKGGAPSNGASNSGFIPAEVVPKERPTMPSPSPVPAPTFGQAVVPALSTQAKAAPPEPEPETLQIDKMMRERAAADDELSAWLEMGKQMLPNLRRAAAAAKEAEEHAQREIERWMKIQGEAAREYNSTMARIRRLEPLVS